MGNGLLVGTIIRPWHVFAARPAEDRFPSCRPANRSPLRSRLPVFAPQLEIPVRTMAGLTIAKRLLWLPRIALFVLMLYVFLGAIELLGISISIFGAEAANRLFVGLENPFAGLAVGILATALLQSSSATTSIVVIAVGSGAMPLGVAVPIIMGANIGTSVTNTLVSLGHVTNDAAFRRAFAGATVHDIFNLMTVAILFPLEMATGFLRRSAQWLVDMMFGGNQLADGAATFKSPIKTAVKHFAKGIRSVFEDGLGIEDNWLGAALVILALAMIVVSLIVITKNMRLLMANRIEVWLNRVLKRSGLLGLFIGVVITMTVQSSSITTSLLVPMFGAGVLQLEAGFPIMLGANIGTTITALLAAMVAGPMGLVIATVHLLFNIVGTAIFFPFKSMRGIPIGISRKLADLAVRNRVWVAVYIVGVFFVIPLIGVLLWR